MNTVDSLSIPKRHLQSLIRDIRRLGLRHRPFTVAEGLYHIELYPNPNNDLLYLKYAVDTEDD